MGGAGAAVHFAKAVCKISQITAIIVAGCIRGRAQLLCDLLVSPSELSIGS